ncbi:transmembrane protein 50A-like [Paramacrobiotus metropolitanus]|uniref:transmembrane protein 50A-like n=1 Tax=Paramacrobiotus metropolitanus TaxID=2943436 RepID=UPI0024457C3A|nr:transmembrane protein 50A-like [Paramacrobiotus metropolitanus]
MGSMGEVMSNMKESLRTGGGLFELTERRNVLAAALAGILFMGGWWCMMDVIVMFPREEQFHHAYHVCGVISTLAFIMINAVSNGQVSAGASGGYSEGCLGQRGARVWLFLGFILAFSALIASAWILFQDYVSASTASPHHDKVWPGVALFLQNILIFLGAIVFKFGRVEESF